MKYTKERGKGKIVRERRGGDKREREYICVEVKVLICVYKGKTT